MMINIQVEGCSIQSFSRVPTIVIKPKYDIESCYGTLKITRNPGNTIEGGNNNDYILRTIPFYASLEVVGAVVIATFSISSRD